MAKNKDVKDNGAKKESLMQALKFGLFSISAGIIEAVSYTIIVALLPKENGVVKFAAAAQLISLALSVIWNFTVNRKFTFKSATNIPIAMLKVAAFHLIFTPLSGWFTAYATGTLLWNEFLVKAICMLTNFVLEFFFCKYVVFRDSLDNSNENEKENNKK